MRFIAGASVLLVVVACSSSATPTSGGGDDGGSTTPPPGAPPSPGDDGGKDAASDAGSCTTAKLPTPGASCPVEGTYRILEDSECPRGGCSFYPPPYLLAVTVNGSVATFTNADPLSMTNFSCTLSGCDCVTKYGKHHVFGATGFVGEESVSGCSSLFLMTGTLQ
jgi:hypothetical protein